jgi:tetratricopeptide (TPR) repeat protein
MGNAKSNSAKRAQQSPTPAPAVPRPRPWFGLAAVIGVPLLLLILTEGLLHLIGVGYPSAFFLHRKIEERPCLTDNQEFGKRFFPYGLVRYPHPFAVPATKAPNTLRIFVLGESAAMGDPDPKFGLPRMLEALLQARYPNRNIEVVNVAMVAINSHVVLPIARECAQRQGDLWVVYMGNNEMIGPFGSISMFGQRVPALPLIRASIAIKQLRLGQGMDQLLNWIGSGGEAPSEWGGMTMWGKHQVRLEDPQTARVHSFFSDNLNAIVSAGVEAGIPIVLCTVATNLKDCAPFGSLHAPHLSSAQLTEWETAYGNGKALDQQGNFKGALDAYKQALAIDPTFAELSFRIGRSYLALGLPVEAAPHFRNARDRDTLQFRTDSTLNAAIRACANAQASKGVHLLDAEELFAATSPQGVPGLEHLYEHVHFTPEGNYLLAQAVAAKAAESLKLDGSGGQPQPTGAPRDWLSFPDCLKEIGFTDWNRHDILARMISERIEQPPFTGQANHAEHIEALRQQLAQWRGATKPVQVQRAARQVQELVTRRPADPDIRWNLAQLWDVAGDLQKAEEHWRALIRLLPHASLPYYNLGKLLDTHGRRDEARELYARSLSLNPKHKAASQALQALAP